MTLYTKEGQKIQLSLPCQECDEDTKDCHLCHGRGWYLTENGFTLLRFLELIK